MRKRTSPTIVEQAIFSVPERMIIHIRQSKYKKDRIVPLAKTMARGLVKYLKAENPHLWLFNGKNPHEWHRLVEWQAVLQPLV
jgi:integrase